MQNNYLSMSPDEFKSLPQYQEHYWNLLGQWRAEKIKLDEAKDNELHLRMLLSDATFDDPREGANNHVFGNDKKAAKLTLTHVINRSVDEAAIRPCLDQLRETIGAAAENIVVYKPSLSVSKYKALTDVQKEILAPAITAKPGTPQLQFKEAK